MTRRLAAAGRWLATLALTYLGLLAVTFFIGRVIPVDPVLAVVGDRAPEHVVQRVREEMGLNKPLATQFAIYLSNAVQGDFGTSVLTRNPVWQDILKAFPATLELATCGILIGAGLGVPLGVWAAVRRGGPVDQGVRVLMELGEVPTAEYWASGLTKAYPKQVGVHELLAATQALQNRLDGERPSGRCIITARRPLGDGAADAAATTRDKPPAATAGRIRSVALASCHWPLRARVG